MTNKKITAEYLHGLFLNDTPLLDVRSEDEYAKGAFPRSTNLPILKNNERRLVGICYKQKGQQAAIKLGLDLVSGDIKTARIRDWCELVAMQPDTHIYCWRGGLRSQITRQWIKEAGVDVPLVEGGYKALRRSLSAVIDEAAKNDSMIRIGGRTGVAKSRLLDRIPYSVNLEKHANHRGSSFGRMISQQPTQVNFEHAFAIDLLRTTHHNRPEQPLFIEDESRNIGTVHIPLAYYDAMLRSKLVLVEMSLEFRVQHILQEYVIDMLASYENENAKVGFERFSHYLQESLWRIQKRLGLERYKVAAELMNKALQTQFSSGDTQQHEAWITLLLTEYYDPMYEYQIRKKQELVVFRGDNAAVLNWALQFDKQNSKI
ncbi:MAG: tRNA 2-selenouridine(34) synthase MnmH [Nitrosomonas sp.]|nr:tRNA 2-selenouridine(34) synthase MnmH [Nitrosomonas sp.]